MHYQDVDSPLSTATPLTTAGLWAAEGVAQQQHSDSMAVAIHMCWAEPHFGLPAQRTGPYGNQVKHHSALPMHKQFLVQWIRIIAQLVAWEPV